jgi:hypothetical protein
MWHGIEASNYVLADQQRQAARPFLFPEARRRGTVKRGLALCHAGPCRAGTNQDAAATSGDAPPYPGIRMKQMPLWDRVIFSDWHGVLSRDPF